MECPALDALAPRPLPRVKTLSKLVSGQQAVLALAFAPGQSPE